MPPPRPKKRTRSTSDEQGWGMLIFESVSAGMIAILLVFALVLVLVGIYCGIVWPLTKWDLAEVDPEKYRFWWQSALLAIFATASAVGFWSFSGAAFRKKRAQGRGAPPAAIGQTLRKP